MADQKVHHQFGRSYLFPSEIRKLQDYFDYPKDNKINIHRKRFTAADRNFEFSLNLTRAEITLIMRSLNNYKNNLGDKNYEIACEIMDKFGTMLEEDCYRMRKEKG